MKKRLVGVLSASALMVMMAAAPVFAANAAPGNSDFVGGGVGNGVATTSNCAPASVPGCAQK